MPPKGLIKERGEHLGGFEQLPSSRLSSITTESDYSNYFYRNTIPLMWLKCLL